jgi:hypothetical protein
MSEMWEIRLPGGAVGGRRIQRLRRASPRGTSPTEDCACTLSRKRGSMRHIWSVRFALETAARHRRSAATIIAVAIALALAYPAAAQAVPKAYIPFPNGTQLHVEQAWGNDPGGCSSHCSQYDYYAWDFVDKTRTPAATEGMSIVSATNGMVVGHRNDFPGSCYPSCSGTGSFGNYVFVHNDDGTYVEYLHMKMGSVVVTDGQRVEVGDPIGQVGRTGNTTGPHLHFGFQKSTSGTGNNPSEGVSIESEFIGISHPFEGENITSNNPGHGSTPPTITTTELPQGTPGQGYTAHLNAIGGAGGYTWSVSAGTLQPGLALTSSGEIAGIPKVAGAFTVTFKVTDHEGHSQSATLVVKVDAPHQELFALASDVSVWHDYFIPGSSSWSGWGSLGVPSSATLVSNVSVGYNSSGEEELFARASDGSVWHDYFIPGTSSWSGWGSLGGASGITLRSDVSVGYNQSGSEELFARASDGSVWHDYFIPGSSSWSGWGSLGSAAGETLQSNVSIGYNQSGSEELFARASDGSVWHDYFIPGSSSWSGWGSLAGASGVTLRSDVSTSESATPLAALGSGPTAMTGAATAVSPVAEELAGSVNPNGETVSECRFEYGSTASYGSSMSCSPSPGEGESPVAVSAAIAGLTPRTVYHFRTVATNATGTSYGGDETFTTLPLTASESTNRGSSQNGGATSGPTPSHSVLASKTRRSASLLSRAITKCRKIKNRHSRARCIVRAKKHYGPDHRHLGGRGRGRR